MFWLDFSGRTDSDPGRDLFVRAIDHSPEISVPASHLPTCTKVNGHQHKKQKDPEHRQNQNSRSVTVVEYTTGLPNTNLRLKRPKRIER
jgi:hypothetical protein